MAALTREALKDIQGWIVSGFAHLPTAAYVFLGIQDAARAKAWLRQVIPEVRTAEEWPLADDGKHRIKPATAVNLAFTHPGLRALGLPDETLATFPGSFIDGMPCRADVLGDTGDSAPDNWELGGPENEDIHVVLVIQGPDEPTVAGLRNAQRARLDANSGLRVVAEQGGTFTGTEHFGFADGISNPFIEGTKGHVLPGGNVARTGEFILGYWNEYGLYPPGPAVPRHRDPDDILPEFPGYSLPQCKDLGRSGSFLVYRKLRQDVAAFWNFVAGQAHDGQGPPDPAVMTWLAAKFVGRWPSGTPLVLAPDRDDPAIGPTNEYTYYPTDKKGFGCPVGAHTRRSNPIDAITNNTPEEALKTSGRHRIMRRAVYFGEHVVTRESFADGRAPIGLDDAGEARGIHFFAINADIERQFEFVQQSWCNSGSFNGLRDNKDPIIGDNDESGLMTIPQWPLRREVLQMPRFVSVMGGAYFVRVQVPVIRGVMR